MDILFLIDTLNYIHPKFLNSLGPIKMITYDIISYDYYGSIGDVAGKRLFESIESHKVFQNEVVPLKSFDIFDPEEQKSKLSGSFCDGLKQINQNIKPQKEGIPS